MKKTLTILCGAVVLLAASAASADFTPAWQGVWEFEYALKFCGSDTPFQTFQSVDSICAGDEYVPAGDDQEVPFECNGNFTDTEVDLECNGTTEPFPGCTATVQMVVHSTRNGNTVQGSQTLSISYQQPCILEDSCIVTEYTGTRTAEDPNCTTTPVTSKSWGILKTIYR